MTNIFQTGSNAQLLFVELRSETEKAGKFPIDHMIISIPCRDVPHSICVQKTIFPFDFFGGSLGGEFATKLRCLNPIRVGRQPYKVGYKWGEMGKWSKWGIGFPFPIFHRMSSNWFWEAHLVGPI